MELNYTLSKDELTILKNMAKERLQNRGFLLRFASLRFFNKLTKINNSFEFTITDTEFLSKRKTVRKFEDINKFEIIGSRLISIDFINNTPLLIPIRVLGDTEQVNTFIEKFERIHKENLERFKEKEEIAVNTNDDVSWTSTMRKPLYDIARNGEFTNPFKYKITAIINIVLVFIGIYIISVYNAITNYSLAKTEFGLTLSIVLGVLAIALGFLTTIGYSLIRKSKLKNPLVKETFDYNVNLTTDELTISYGDYITSYNTSDIVNAKKVNLGFRIYFRSQGLCKDVLVFHLGAYPEQTKLFGEKLKSIVTENSLDHLMKEQSKKLINYSRITIVIFAILALIFININSISIFLVSHLMPHYFAQMQLDRNARLLINYVHKVIPATHTVYIKG